MSREIWDTQNCVECGSVRAALICEIDLDEDGNERKAVWWDRMLHGTKECHRFRALNRETWPVLFEMEAQHGRTPEPPREAHP